MKRAIDFEKLKEILSDDISEEKEVYEFTWPGKREAIETAHKLIRKTLRPVSEASEDWETTENIYIEGDNLEVLKLLQESYLEKIKFIYIDPPYNTGNDFIYEDNFTLSSKEYARLEQAIDQSGNRMIKNSLGNGRFHSDWCSFIYPRLLLSRNLLKKDGVMFISVDDNEIHNLRKICDEIFGETNFIAQINWKGRGGRQDSKYYAVIHEYILCYAKNSAYFEAGEEIKQGDVYPKFDSSVGRYYKTQLLRKWGSNSRRIDRPNLFYPIFAPNGDEVYPLLHPLTELDRKNFPESGKEGCWRWGKETMNKAIADGRVLFSKDKNGSWVPYEKIYAPASGEEKTKKYLTWIDGVPNGTARIKELFGSAIFDYSKSPELIKRFLKMADVQDGDIVLDFFSGSATTAEAVLSINLEDGKKRKFIMVQIPEEVAEKSEAFNHGYKNICEIGEERIRKAASSLKTLPDTRPLDSGFRVFRLSSSNMKDIYYSPDSYQQDLLSMAESNIKEDRTDLDLLFGCLLEWGLELSKPYKSEEISGVTVHTYDEDALVACFADNVPEEVIREIAKRQPLRAVFRDSSFGDDAARVNVSEIFKLLSPDTEVKVL